MLRPRPPIAVSLALAALAAFSEAQALELREGDRICLLGNALAERMQHHGWLETRLQSRFPELGLSFRNLGFSADELTVRQRTAGFGSSDDWLTRCEADVIFAFFGHNESFAGEEGIAKFRADLTAFVRHTRAQAYNGEGPPRLVLFTPVPHEDLGDPGLSDGDDENARLAGYARALAIVALAEDVAIVDLFGPMQERYEAAAEPLTIDGIHLTENGNRELARVIEAALFPGEGAHDPDRLARIRDAVLDKNLLWFNRYRATDGYNVYGGRSGLKYTDDVSNFEVLQREMEVLDALCANLDRRIQAIARGGDEEVADDDVPPLIDVVTNRPGEGPDGAHVYLGGDEAVGSMTPAEGMEVELFASEEQFPELVNPVQMAFDTRGRLWVAAWPTYPHWEPGQPMNDKLLILEDTDGDGRADECKVFAGDLHNPTGFELWNGGVFVANPPDLLFLEDTDGDDVADARERVLHGLSSGDTHHSANSFVIGPDGALYFQEGVFHQSQVETIHGPVRNHDACVWRFEPRTWRVERYVPYGFANPHGHVFDRWGQDFVTDGTGNVNYYALPFSGHVEHPAKHAGYFPFFEQRSRPCAATEILSSRHFPAASQGNYLVANVIGFQGIFQYRIEDDGSGFSATEVTPIVHSSDPSFRPSDIEVGPDGAIWFLDWHNALIGHMQHHLRDPSRDHAHGRVYRVTYPGRPLLEPVPIAGRPVPELLELLKSPEDRVRYRARIELSARATDEVVEEARAWVAGLDDGDADRAHHLLEALWLQQQHDVLDGELLGRTLRSPDHRARAAATRVLRGMRRHVGDPIRFFAVQVEDEHPRVRLEAVVALSFFPEARAAETALLALRKETDRFLDYALEETLSALEPHWRPVLAAGDRFAADNPAGLAFALARLDDDELAGVRPSEALFAEMLARHGLEGAAYAHAAEGLARLRGTDPGAELLAAIDRADAGEGRNDGHADHLLSGLFAALGDLPAATRARLASPLRTLSTEGRRASTRRLATAARITAEGSVEPAWEEAVRSLGGLGDLLDAAPLLDEASIAEALFPRVLALLDGPPPGLADETAAGGTRGRYVRVELPGERRTLTLAEVEVLRDGANIAPSGEASQSSINWGGAASRAMDGNRSGVYGDGGQTHTVEDLPNPWWELDLGGERTIDTIVLWNRGEADGRYASRLDGYVVRVLDGERRTVFHAKGGRAPLESVTHDVSAPALRVRRAAVRALPALGVREGEAIHALVRRFDDADLRGAVVEALRSVPFERWPDEATVSLGAALLAHFESRPEEELETGPGRELLALADELAPRLDRELAASLRRARRRLGPQVVVIRPVPDSLLYDRKEFTVVAGRPVELVFDNVDIMPHNLLVTVPGALAEVGKAAERMAAAPDAWSRGYVPDLPQVLQATRLLQPGESQTLRFDAPGVPGDHPYVCTFPGHWVRMNGLMHVVTELAEGFDEPALAEAAPARAFVRNWSMDDLRPHLDAVDERPADRGRAVFEAASCQRCHAIGSEGGTTGPELREVVAKYGREELLLQIVEPSRVIAEEYVSEIFFTIDGLVLSGRVVSDDGQVVRVQDDPYQERDPRELPVEEIEERMVSDVSTMPSGLLSTFERGEILDLLAYLEALAPSDG